jgi:dipeptidyl aminopeptidase/acylaminoacyl peptidase
MKNLNILLLISLLLAACGGVAPAPALATAPVPTASTPPPVVRVVTATFTPEAPPTSSLTATQSPLPSLTPQPLPTTTPDPYAGLTIPDLAARSYGAGWPDQPGITAQETLAVNTFFTRTLIAYPSDGLAIYGFMDHPLKGNGLFPVVIAVHGYIDPSIYATLDYTTRYADALARAGFLVLHPNLRGYPPSDDGDNFFRVGMAVDVLNLIALVRSEAGKPGPLAQADPNAIGLWGHSMGGGIVTRVITVDPGVRAAVLYGAMSGDEQKNYERIFTYFSPGTRGQEELRAPPEALLSISPIYFLDRIQAAVSINHGKQDPDVPLAWSLDLCERLKALDKPVECYTYDGQGHTFHGDGDVLFVQRTIDFFNRTLH